MENCISDEKKIFRKQAASIRNSLLSELRDEYNEIIFQKIISSDIYKESENLLVYVSFGSEVDTHRLILKALDDRKNVAVPKVTGPGEMHFYRISSWDDLSEAGFRGIPQPSQECNEILTSGLMILPGLAFDRKLFRMGYGGGFYDRFTDKYGSQLFKCAIAYETQIYDHIPCDSHDCSMNMIITENNIYR